jgi:TRAP-type C4-dicarboxylate transport system permease small subunit
VNALLRRLALVFAVAGAAVGLATAVMVVVSVVGRALVSRPIQGDVEITQFAIALSISLGLPWCQWRRANIIVDFFTQRARAGTRRSLDAAGCALIAAMCALLAWRTGAGALALHAAGETTMVLALPVWWVYAALAPGLALTALIALLQGWQHLNIQPVGDDGDAAKGAAP